MRTFMVNRWTFGVVGLMMAGVLIFLFWIGRNTANANEGGTLIRLSPPEFSLETDAHGTVQYFGTALKFDVKDMPCPGSLPVPLEVKDQVSFALYVDAEDLGYTRLATFTPMCSWNVTAGTDFEVGGQGTYQGIARTDGQIDFRELSDPVFEVWVEFDDGVNTPVSLGSIECNEFCRLLTSAP